VESSSYFAIMRKAVIFVAVALVLGTEASKRPGCTENFQKICEDCKNKWPEGDKVFGKQKPEDVTENEKEFAVCVFDAYGIMDEKLEFVDDKLNAAMKEEIECMAEEGKTIDDERWQKETKECQSNCKGDNKHDKCVDFLMCTMKSYGACVSL
ncbi:Protein of unknown function, partial [Gryllus bimaculatus]